MTNELCHYGVKGMKWGVRRYQDHSGKYSDHGRLHRRKEAVFVSGSSKTEFEDSGYYRKQLPKPVRDELDACMKRKARIVVGDAPGIDRQTQRYLKQVGYRKVTVYGPGKKVRYTADKRWQTKPIDAPEYEEGSKEWLAKKDIAMERAATTGIAVVLDEGSKATRKNVERLVANNKNVKVYQLSKNGELEDRWVE